MGQMIPRRNQRLIIEDRYMLVELLGSGGMAKVYLAYDRVMGCDVALKILKEQYADDEEIVALFRHEAQNTARFSHPNIVSIRTSGRTPDGVYYIVMEYLSRGTLKDYIKRHGVLKPYAAVGVALQVASAVTEAHEKGVIHRDIKPENILVTKTGDVKVTDFGIAKSASSPATSPGDIFGTASYMSPEQASGGPVGPQSDLYSLGVVLFEMLSGELPYRAQTSIGTAMKHVNQSPRSPRELNPLVPEILGALTVKLLAKDPKARPPSAADLADDLEKVLLRLPSVDSPLVSAGVVSSVPVRALGQGVRRRRVRLARPLVALLVGAGLLGGLVFNSIHDDLNLPRSASSANPFAVGSGSPNSNTPDDEAPPSEQTISEAPVQKQKEKGKHKDTGKQKGKGKQKTK